MVSLPVGAPSQHEQHACSGGQSQLHQPPTANLQPHQPGTACNMQHVPDGTAMHAGYVGHSRYSLFAVVMLQFASSDTPCRWYLACRQTVSPNRLAIAAARTHSFSIENRRGRRVSTGMALAEVIHQMTSRAKSSKTVHRYRAGASTHVAVNFSHSPTLTLQHAWPSTRTRGR